MRHAAGACAILVTLLACAVVACSYSSRRLTAFPSARTIAVVPVRNLGYRRDIENRLTQAIVREIRARTPLALSSPDTADLILRGSTDGSEQLLVIGRDGRPFQKRFMGRMQFTITERATGKVVKRTRVDALAEFRTVPVLPDEPIGEVENPVGESLEGSAIEEWTRRVAERVVQSMERGL